jgi:hypothetical protein
MHHSLTGKHYPVPVTTRRRYVPYNTCVAYKVFICRPWPARRSSVPRSSSQQHHESSNSMDLDSLPHMNHLTVAFLSGLKRGRCTYQCYWQVADFTSFDQPGDQRLQSTVEGMSPKVMAELYSDDKPASFEIGFCAFWKGSWAPHPCLIAIPDLAEHQQRQHNIPFSAAQ